MEKRGIDISGELGGPAYFYCERMRATIKKQRCIEFQNLAEQASIRWDSVASDRAETCLDCRKGREIMEEKQVVQDESKPEFPCKKCQVNEAIRLKDKDKPAHHGMCRECFGDAIRKAREKNKKEKIQKAVDESGRKVVYVDFGNYPEILDAVRKKARNEVRTLEEQILWECASGTALVGSLQTKTWVNLPYQPPKELKVNEDLEIDDE